MPFGVGRFGTAAVVFEEETFGLELIMAVAKWGRGPTTAGFAIRPEISGRAAGSARVDRTAARKRVMLCFAGRLKEPY